MAAGRGAVARNVFLSDNLKTFIEEWRKRPGNLIMILHRIQREYRYVPRELAFEVARILDIPLAKIYGVITFYHFFRLEKPGETNFHICTGTACYMKGAGELISELESLLEVRAGGTTADGRFSMETVRCVGCCGLAPVIMVENEVYGKLTTEKLPEVISHYGG